MADQYFVTIRTTHPSALARLRDLDLDLFHPTARKTDPGAVIEGLLTMAQIERVVRAGYQVLVEEEASKRARATEVVGFESWLVGQQKGR